MPADDIVVLVREGAVEVDDGLLARRHASVESDKLAGLLPKAFVAAATAAEQRLADARQKASEEAVQGLEVSTTKLDMAIAVLKLADLTGDGAAEWIVGGDKGVAAYTPDGGRLWLFETGRPVQCLDVADVDGDGRPEVAVGGADEYVRLLDANGAERWSFACRPSEGSIDGPPAVDYVKVADLDGDGTNEVIAGANWVHVLDASGKLRWEKYMAFRRGRIVGDFVAGDVTDLNGDGTQEVIALFTTSYPVLVAYDADGNIVTPAGDPGSHGGLNTDVPVAVAAMDLFGGQTTKQIVAAGAGRIGLYWHDQQNKEQAGGQVAGTFVSMARWQPDPARPPVIFGADSMRGIRAIAPEPRRADRWIEATSRWYRSLDDKITRLLACDLDGDGSGEVIAGTKPGNVHVLDAGDGSIRGFARSVGATGPTAAVTCLAWDDASQSVLVGRQDGSVLRLRAEP